MRQKKNRELAMKKIKNGNEEVEKTHEQVSKKYDGAMASFFADKNLEEGMTMNNTSLSYFGLTANR